MPVMKAGRLQANARAIALEIAAEARAEWGFASEIIARTFRAHRELASGDRRRISETVYSLIRMDRRLDAILEELLGRVVLLIELCEQLLLLGRE